MAEKITQIDDVLIKAVKDLQKEYGSEAISILGSRDINVEAVPTGCLTLDYILGIGGLPKGRIIEIYGPPSGGKTTIAQHIIATIQKNGGKAAFIDAECAFDPERAKKIGINVEDLIFSQPEYGEQGLQMVEKLLETNKLDIIVVDSVAALVPKVEMDGEIGDSHMGLQARMMSQAMRKLTGLVSRTKTILIFINQVRSKIGIVYGNPEVTTGGNALSFYSSVRLEVRKSAPIKMKDDIVGNAIKIKVVKNKVASPGRECAMQIFFNHGISKYNDIITLGTELGVLTQNGSYIKFEDKSAQGENNFKKKLRDSPTLMTSIVDKIKSKMLEEKKKDKDYEFLSTKDEKDTTKDEKEITIE